MYLVVKSSYFQACVYLKNANKNDPRYLEHKKECPINHSGSAGKMEVDAVLEIFQRSEELFGVRYWNYVGDGDAKTFMAILDKRPYGDELNVIQSECVGHVEKRKGSRLRNIKKTAKLGGKGKLTDALIRKTKYYGLAIRRQADSVDDVKNAVLATDCHLSSSDNDPQHQYCPPGTDSW